MHYYQFNIGDYAKSTLHLSIMEDLAYRRLLDRYYDTEKPLEKDIDKLCRFIRMAEYKTETQQILNEFFKLTKNGWIQKRVVKELEAYSLKADTARANGKKGGRPKKTQSVSSGMPEQTQGKAKQEPLTINQETITKVENSTAKAERIPYQKISDLYCEKCENLSGLKILTDKRKAKIKKFWNADAKHQKIEFYENYFNHVNQISFLTGDNDRGWKADLEFLMNIDNLAKILENKYQ